MSGRGEKLSRIVKGVNLLCVAYDFAQTRSKESKLVIVGRLIAAVSVGSGVEGTVVIVQPHRFHFPFAPNVWEDARRVKEKNTQIHILLSLGETRREWAGKGQGLCWIWGGCCHLAGAGCCYLPAPRCPSLQSY